MDAGDERACSALVARPVLGDRGRHRGCGCDVSLPACAADATAADFMALRTPPPMQQGQEKDLQRKRLRHDKVTTVHKRAVCRVPCRVYHVTLRAAT